MENTTSSKHTSKALRVHKCRQSPVYEECAQSVVIYKTSYSLWNAYLCFGIFLQLNCGQTGKDTVSMLLFFFSVLSQVVRLYLYVDKCTYDKLDLFIINTSLQMRVSYALFTMSCLCEYTKVCMLNKLVKKKQNILEVGHGQTKFYATQGAVLHETVEEGSFI